jgi:hypothetical protein
MNLTMSHMTQIDLYESFGSLFLKRDIEAWPEENSKEFIAVLEELRSRV